MTFRIDLLLSCSRVPAGRAWANRPGMMDLHGPVRLHVAILTIAWLFFAGAGSASG